MKKYVYKYKRATNWDVKKQKYNYKTLSDIRVSPILKCKTEQGLDMEVFIIQVERKRESTQNGMNEFIKLFTSSFS